MSHAALQVRLDLNNPVFQATLFGLEKTEQLAVLSTLKKLSGLTWGQVYQVYKDVGLKWEAIVSRLGPKGERLYSFRLGRKCRALAYREGEWLRVLPLHPDHDSAYK